MSTFKCRFVAAAIVLSMIAPVAGDPAKSFPRGPYPRVFTTTETIAAAVKRADRMNWADSIRDKVLRDAENALASPFNIPEMGGQWGQHYNCKECGTKLSYSNNQHLCPNCKKEYKGWPYDQVVAGKGHINNWSAVKDLGVAYGLSGDLRFASRAREILIGYAKRYTAFPYHDYQGGALPKGARILAQTLDESVRVLDLVYGYDIIHDSPALTQPDRDQIDELLREIARTIRRHDAGISNWQTWHNAAFASIGAVTGDEALFDHAMNGRSGVHFQLANSVLTDGFWYEGTAGYHFYSLAALRHTAEAARSAGIDLYKLPR